MASMDWYGQALLGQFNGSHAVDWDTDTIKVAVLDSGHTPDLDTHEFWSDVSADEVAAQGDYVAGGITLTCTASYDSANDRVKLDASDLALTTTISGRYLVVYKDTGTDTTSPLLGLYDNGAADFGGGTSLDITWDATGVLRLTRV